MRSQSVVGVLCYDIYLLTALQELIANELGIPLGWYEHHMMSAHFYNREGDLKFVKAMLDAGEPTEPMPMKPIEYDLSTAKVIYPMAYNAVLNGTVEEFTEKMHSDPILSELGVSTLTV
jgi:hypothetical protein